MRAADVVEDLLTIARGVASGKEVLNLNTVVKGYLDSAEHHKLEKIHPLSAFKTELDSELLNVTGSASHANKILMNLVTNASEAIEGSGTVTISTANRYLDEPLKGYEDVRTGEYVLLTVSDLTFLTLFFTPRSFSCTRFFSIPRIFLTGPWVD